MPRQTKRPIVFLALSPAATANALCLEPRKIYAAIANGKLPVFMNGANRRILVADTEKWVRSWPAPKRAKRKSRKVPSDVR